MNYYTTKDLNLRRFSARKIKETNKLSQELKGEHATFNPKHIIFIIILISSRAAHFGVIHKTTELCLCEVANVPNDGFFETLASLMLKKTPSFGTLATSFCA